MANEMTYAQALEIAINSVTDETAKARLTALRSSLMAKASKPTKAHLETEAFRARVLAFAQEALRPLSVEDIVAGVEGATPNKVISACTYHCKANAIVRGVTGGKVYYTAT